MNNLVLLNLKSLVLIQMLCVLTVWTETMNDVDIATIEDMLNADGSDDDDMNNIDIHRPPHTTLKHR